MSKKSFLQEYVDHLIATEAVKAIGQKGCWLLILVGARAGALNTPVEMSNKEAMELIGVGNIPGLAKVKKDCIDAGYLEQRLQHHKPPLLSVGLRKV